MKRISANQANDEIFFQIPKALQTDDFYKPMSVYAKYLYGVLKDRFKLSLKNNWVDQDGYIYIYCTVKDIQDILGIGKTKATQIKHELQKYDLLEEVQQGINKPNRIYVGQVVFHRVEASNDADVQNMNPRTTGIRTPGRPEYERQDDRNMNGNNTELNKTNISNTELIHSLEDDDEYKGIAREGEREKELAVQKQTSELLSTESWLYNLNAKTLLLDWTLENPVGAYTVLNSLVDQFWRLRRAQDEGQNMGLGVAYSLDKIFTNAKQIADENVVDGRKYFDYLANGLELQTDKLLISMAH